MVSIFAITEPSTQPEIGFSTDDSIPKKVRVFHLEDEDGTLGGLRVIEYDLTFSEIPPHTTDYLKEVLRRVCSQGAYLAWLGLEGSFHYDHLLADDISYQIYGVCSNREEPTVLLDEEDLLSLSWKRTLSRYRRMIGLLSSA